ncbi:methyltransferase [Beijerinckia sp. L45]|uniref:methyltransferase n=1 Tax=Beijerinckia sp. L45 TaxID=1641855 RepID=UPI00131C0817|nr:methyltransferase [Beijerinckia sp. L45]
MTSLADPSGDAKPSLRERWFAYRNQKLADPKFQRWAASFPLTRPIASQRAKALFDLSAGFVYSQVLFACVKLSLFEALADGPLAVDALASRLDLPAPAMARLLGAAAGLKLVEKIPDGRYGLGVHGAAYLGNPAIKAMVEHHALLYRDLEDPVALLRDGKRETALSSFWPYAQADNPGTIPAEAVAPYSELMASSQALIADDVLDAYPFIDHGTLMDVGGGDGAFLLAAARRRPDLSLILFDLPAVAESADQNFKASRLANRASVIGGDFTTEALPKGADLISLVRVLHDHDDATAALLLRKVFDALVPGGILLLAEPFADTPQAESVGAYFQFYLLAMRQGRPRSERELMTLLYGAGFGRVRPVATARPMLASLLVAQKSAGPANRSVKSS